VKRRFAWVVKGYRKKYAERGSSDNAQRGKGKEKYSSCGELRKKLEKKKRKEVGNEVNLLRRRVIESTSS